MQFVFLSDPKNNYLFLPVYRRKCHFSLLQSVMIINFSSVSCLGTSDRKIFNTYKPLDIQRFCVTGKAFEKPVGDIILHRII